MALAPAVPPIAGAALPVAGVGVGVGAGVGAGTAAAGGGLLLLDTALVPPLPPPPHPLHRAMMAAGKSALTKLRAFNCICQNPPASPVLGRRRFRTSRAIVSAR